MFAELNAQLGYSGSSANNPPKGHFTLVTESDDVDSSFLIHHYLSWYLKCGCRVVFLALAQSFSHYNAVAQKLGVNLTVAKTSGHLVIISGLQFCFPLMRSGEENEKSEENVLRECICTKSLQPLYQILQEALGRRTDAQSHLTTLLLIDDLSVLLSLGINTRQIYDFVQYCQACMFGLGQDVQGSIVTLLHCDASQEEDEDVTFLGNRLRHACTCHLKVEGLTSGFCKDVHGQITIQQWSSSKDYPTLPKKMLQFKILDKSVSFFAAGTSSAVL